MMFSFLIAASSLLVLVSSDTSCNLLSSSKSYYNYSSFSSIASLCSSGGASSSSLSAWEQYQCDYIIGRNESCWPRRYFSSCAPGELRGVAVLYHGYSACPDQYELLVPVLQEACYHVYLPTTVGHGLSYCQYSNSSEDEDEYDCIDGGYDISELPTRRAGYLEFVDYINEIMSEEVEIIKTCELEANSAWGDGSDDEFDVMLGGLSLGAGLSSNTAYRAYKYDVNWTKQVLMSPFLGVSYAGADEILYKCNLNDAALRACLPYYFDSIGLDFDFDNSTSGILTNLTYDIIASYVNTEFIDSSYETLNLLIRKVLTYIVETNDTDVTENENIQNLLDTTIGWGSGCIDDQEIRNRGGFCNFKVRNLLAAHSLGSYILDNSANSASLSVVVDSLFIMVERDGAVRNSLVAQYAQQMYSNNAATLTTRSMSCMWLISSDCQSSSSSSDEDVGNTCGVPHSSMAVADNVGKAPGFLYWNETYIQGIAAFATATQARDGNDISVSYPAKFATTDPWDGGRDECVAIDMNDPPEALVADVPAPASLILDLVQDAVTQAVQNRVLNFVSNITNVPRGVLELTIDVKEHVNLDSFLAAGGSAAHGASATSLDVEDTTASSASDTSDSDGDNYVLMKFLLTSDATWVLESLLRYDALKTLDGYDVMYATVSGSNFVVYNASTMEDDDDVPIDKAHSDKGGPGVTWFIVAGVVLFLLILGGVVYYRRYKKLEKMTEEDESVYERM